MIPLLSKPLLAEYGAVLSDPAVVRRFPELTEERVQLALRRLRYLAEYFRAVRATFEFDRDPRDEMLIELAIAGKATDIVSGDEDLLSLPAGHDDASRRFRQRMPKLRVMPPARFLDFHSAQFEH